MCVSDTWSVREVRMQREKKKIMGEDEDLGINCHQQQCKQSKMV